MGIIAVVTEKEFQQDKREGSRAVFLCSLTFPMPLCAETESRGKSYSVLCSAYSLILLHYGGNNGLP